MNKFIGVVVVVLVLLLVRSRFQPPSSRMHSNDMASQSTNEVSRDSETEPAPASPNAASLTPVSSATVAAGASTSYEKSIELSPAFTRLQSDSKIPWDTHVDSVDARIRHKPRRGKERLPSAIGR